MISGKKKTIIIGAGAAGLFAARALVKQGHEVVLLERDAQVGGKCRTYTHPDQPDIKTELGAALLAPNYGVVLDAVNEKGIIFEDSLKTERHSIGFFQKLDALSWSGKALFALQMVSEWAKFTLAVRQYQQARHHHLPLPEDFELPFSMYAQKYGVSGITDLLRPLVTGFGYGAMEDIPAYSVMEYTGIGTLPAMAAESALGKAALTGIKGGFQHLLERVAEDFNVITSAKVHRIDRQPDRVTVAYDVEGETRTLDAEALVLAIPPMYWPSLGMPLTPVEQRCVEAVSYYRYPVAVCKLDGLPAQHSFIPDALEKEGTGHLALITTRDNRQSPVDGRLATAYINLPPGDNSFSLDKKTSERRLLKAELRQQKGVRAVKIVETKIWDYMPSLPWDLRLELEAQQLHPDTGTLYVGAYPLGGFEDVRCVADQATRVVERYMPMAKALEENRLSYANKELQRAHGFFFSIPRVAAVTDPGVSNNSRL